MGEFILIVAGIIFLIKVYDWVFPYLNFNSKSEDSFESSSFNDLEIRKSFPNSVYDIVHEAIDKGKDLEIDYQNYNGEKSRRRLSDISLNNEYSGYHNAHIKAYCHKRNEERNFKISRISRAQIVD